MTKINFNFNFLYQYQAQSILEYLIILAVLSALIAFAGANSSFQRIRDRIAVHHQDAMTGITETQPQQ